MPCRATLSARLSDRSWVAAERPSRRRERALLRESGAGRLAGMDEVGRGSIAGPVMVGVVVVTLETPAMPTGLRDSKLLTPARRDALVPRIEAWAHDHALGVASAAEIDEWGLSEALRLAGQRALAGLMERPDLVLLDGSFNWLGGTSSPDPVPPVVTQVKADLRCAAVAAASVLAKVSRDALMRTLAGEFPAYGWDRNKGYGSPDHLAALKNLGPTVEHRRTWRLGGS